MARFRVGAARPFDTRRHDQRTTGEASIMARRLKENDRLPDEAGDQPGQGGPDSGGQSGDTQGVSQAVDAAEESVEELAAAGQDYEAQVLKGVEEASDHRGRPVPNHGGQQRRAHAAPHRRPA
jgi:hypothetical protein